MFAIAAMRARVHYAFVFGPAAEAHIQKTAEGQSKKSGKQCNERTNHAWVEYTIQSPGLWDSG